MEQEVTLRISNELDGKHVLFSALHYFTETVTYAIGNRCLRKQEAYPNTLHGLLSRGVLDRGMMTVVRDETHRIAAVISPVSDRVRLEISFFKKGGVEKPFCSLWFTFSLKGGDPKVELLT